MADDAVFNHNVKGKDGVRPSWNRDGRWNPGIALHELYMGENGGRQIDGVTVPLIVGNVLDYVEDVEKHETFQITALNRDTLVPTLEPITRNSQSLTTRDILTARGPGIGAADNKISIDTTVFPHRLDVSPFMLIYSVEARYAKIIAGSIYGDHRVVGFLMTPSGTLVDDKIPLDLLQDVAGVTNYQVKSVSVCYTNQEVKDGDTLSVVLFSATGTPLSSTQLVVENTNWMRTLNAPREYIKDVYIESPYLSTTVPNEILLPLNWNQGSMNMIGVVEYQSGRKVRLPIDGRKFLLEGVQQHLSSIPGHRYNMRLKYKLDPGENTVTNQGAFNSVIPRDYRIRSVEIMKSYSAKLFVYPVWDVGSASYRLKFYLSTLDRNSFIDVTSYVSIVAGTSAFDGLLFGTTQRLLVSLSLKKVFPTYKPFVHTQSMEVTLYGSPNDYRAPWTVKHNAMDQDSVQGVDMFATKAYDGANVNLKGGFSDAKAWLDAYFHRTRPLLLDTTNPESYPTVTHFDVLDPSDSSKVTEFSIDQWDKDLIVSASLTTLKNLLVVWKHKTVTEDIIISGTSLMIRLPE